MHKLKTNAQCLKIPHLCTKTGNQRGTVFPGNVISNSSLSQSRCWRTRFLSYVPEFNQQKVFFQVPTVNNSQATSKAPERGLGQATQYPQPLAARPVTGASCSPASRFSVHPGSPRRSTARPDPGTLQSSLQLARAGGAGCTAAAAGPRSPRDPETLGPAPRSLQRTTDSNNRVFGTTRGL